jgi:uncharacterized protein
MKIDLRQLEEFPARKTIEADPEKFSLDYEGVQQVKRVTADLLVQKTGEEFYCRGKVEAVVDLECARCLCPFEAQLENDVDFFVSPKGLHEDEEGTIEDDEDYAWLEGNSLQADITDIVRQAIILAIDLKPLCEEQCEGLCPECGCNLNEEDCDCETERIDPRWEALKKLKEQNND